MRQSSKEQRSRTQFKKLALMCQTLSLISLLVAHGCAQTPDASAARKTELAVVLNALLKIPPPPADPDESSLENPGWYGPANRQALRDFIAKYSDTEEAYLAEVWLVFAQSITEINRGFDVHKIDRTDRVKAREQLTAFLSERKHTHAELAETLKGIISKTAKPATAKMARILRTGQILQADEGAEFEKQANEILAHIKEYESEKDAQFLRFMEVIKTPPSEEEPTLRHMLVINECHQHHLDKALALAKALKHKFPTWSKLNGVDGNIHMLEHGRSPFPTWEDMSDRGRSFSNKWSRTVPSN